MKLPTITLLAVALVVGCSKPTPSDGGTVASNTTAGSQVATTAGTPAGGTTAPAAGTAGAATPSNAPPAGGAAPGAVPGKGAPPVVAGTATGGAATPPGAPPQMTPEQQKMLEKMKQDAAKSESMADKATHSTFSGVSGTYVGFFDESKLPAAAKSQPGYAEQLVKVKENAAKARLTVAANGDITIKGFGPNDVSGFCAKADGKTGFVFVNPKPAPGSTNKRFVPVTVKSSGSVIDLGGPLYFKKS